MLSKQETIELLRYPIYKVEVSLALRQREKWSYFINCRKICMVQHSIYRKLMDYIYTQESVKRNIIDKGHIVYQLQLRNDEVYEVSDEILNELGSIINIETTTIEMSIGNDRLYELG